MTKVSTPSCYFLALPLFRRVKSHGRDTQKHVPRLPRKCMEQAELWIKSPHSPHHDQRTLRPASRHHELQHSNSWVADTSVVLSPDPAKNLRMNCAGKLIIRLREHNASLPTCQMRRRKQVLAGCGIGRWQFVSHHSGLIDCLPNSGRSPRGERNRAINLPHGSWRFYPESIAGPDTATIMGYHEQQQANPSVPPQSVTETVVPGLHREGVGYSLAACYWLGQHKNRFCENCYVGNIRSPNFE